MQVQLYLHFTRDPFVFLLFLLSPIIPDYDIIQAYMSHKGSRPHLSTFHFPQIVLFRLYKPLECS